MQRVYDFDKTIYDGDSTTHFVCWCFAHHLHIWKYAAKVIRAVILYAEKKYDADEFKKELYVFLKDIKNIDRDVERFWKTHAKNIKPWYLSQQQDNDIIISASSYFLLSPIAEKLGFTLIASEVDKKTGALLRPNNGKEAKVREFEKLFPGLVVDEFYSDSDDDLPMARFAKKAIKVKGNRLTPWVTGQ